MTALGPNLSFNLPAAIATTPLSRKQSEYAPEVIALVHPNSVSTGLKKTPKEYSVPYIDTKIRKPAITTI